MKKILKHTFYIVNVFLFIISRLLTVGTNSEIQATRQTKNRRIQRANNMDRDGKPVIYVTYHYTKKKVDFQKINHKLVMLEKNMDIDRPHQSGSEFGKIARQLSGGLLYGKAD